jgi:hypothetical protein
MASFWPRGRGPLGRARRLLPPVSERKHDTGRAGLCGTSSTSYANLATRLVIDTAVLLVVHLKRAGQGSSTVLRPEERRSRLIDGAVVVNEVEPGPPVDRRA